MLNKLAELKEQQPMLLECVPNLSEGRNGNSLEQLWQELQSIPHLLCLHRCSDRDHHRSVLTLAGPPESIRLACHALFAWANQKIDLRQHSGVHPRIGAVDVLPLVPLQGISEASAVAFSHELAAELAQTWQVPIYLYEQSALSSERSALPQIRKGGFENLSQKMQQPQWQADFGPIQPHPRLGASVLGVRPILIAWNVWLKSQDLALAQHIARQIRASNGGFDALRALGLYLPEQQQVQVSMNLLDYRQTSLFSVMTAIRKLCQSADVAIDRSEFIGLPPQEAFVHCAMDYLKTEASFTPQQLLEAQIQNHLTLQDSVPGQN